MSNIITNNIWLLLAAICGALTPVYVKYYLNVHNAWLFACIAINECILIYCYMHLFAKKSILNQFTLVKILSISIVIIFSILVFKMPLQIKTILGICTAFLTIILLS